MQFDGFANWSPILGERKRCSPSQADLLRLERMLKGEVVSLQEKLQSGLICFWHEESKKRISRPTQYFHTLPNIVSVAEPVDEAKCRLYLIFSESDLKVELWPQNEILCSYLSDDVRFAAEHLARLWMQEGDSRSFVQHPHQPLHGERLMREIYHNSNPPRLRAQVWQHTDTRFEVRYHQWEYIELGEEAYVILRRDKTTYAGDPQSAIDISQIEMEAIADTWHQMNKARLMQPLNRP